MKNIYEPIKSKRRNIILDTDIGPDCDDAAAIAILFEMQKEHNFHISGIVNSSSNPYGTKAIETLCKYYEYNDIPIGSYSKPDGLGDQVKYNKYLANNILPTLKGKDNPKMDSLELYKNALENSEDDGTVIITIGSFLAICEALRTYPELFEKKVNAVISMAGRFTERKTEFNVEWSVPAAKYFFDSFKNTVICSGFEVGVDVITGFEDMVMPDLTNPVKMSYYLFTDGLNTRPSWDLTAVEFAVNGQSDLYRLSEPGIINVTKEGFTEHKINDNGKHMYIIKNAPSDTIAIYLNDLLKKAADKI